MKKILILIFFAFFVISCKEKDKISADISHLKSIEIIQCYELEEIYSGFLKFNDILKNDSSRSIIFPKSKLSLLNEIEEFADYPLFSVFKPSIFFYQETRTFLPTCFLGNIANNNRSILMSQFSDTLVKNCFPKDINFFYIPSPVEDNVSVLIGAKKPNFIATTKDILSGFGFEKIKSYDLKGNPEKLSDNEKSFMPYLVFNGKGKSLFASGEYLIKLSFDDTTVFQSLDRLDMKYDTIFFLDLFTRNYIDKILK